MPILINFIGLQLTWFACVVGGAKSNIWLCLLVGLPFIAWHLYQSKPILKEFKLIVITLIIGVIFDQTVLLLNLVQYPPHGWPDAILPLWMFMLWAIFATALNVSLRWMRGRLMIASLFGLIGAPLSYLAGVKLGAMLHPATPAFYVVISVGWALIMPVLILFSQRYDGFK